MYSIIISFLKVARQRAVWTHDVEDCSSHCDDVNRTARSGPICGASNNVAGVGVPHLPSSLGAHARPAEVPVRRGAADGR